MIGMLLLKSRYKYIYIVQPYIKGSIVTVDVVRQEDGIRTVVIYRDVNCCVLLMEQEHQSMFLIVTI